MAIRLLSSAVKPSGRTSYAARNDNTAAVITQLTTDIAAAQAIGVGDASAEIDAIDATFQTLINSSALGNIVVSFDDAAITSISQLREALRQLAEDPALKAILTD